MNKKQIVTLLLIAALSVGIISLYTTFAYNEEASLMNESESDYNLIYSIKKSTDKNIYINAKEEKYIDIVITNTYKANLKYGAYYKLINPKEIPENVTISLSEDSVDSLQDIIKSNETKIISIKIKNESDYNINITVGTLVGFEKGNIEELISKEEILIK